MSARWHITIETADGATAADSVIERAMDRLMENLLVAPDVRDPSISVTRPANFAGDDR